MCVIPSRDGWAVQTTPLGPFVYDISAGGTWMDIRTLSPEGVRGLHERAMREGDVDLIQMVRNFQGASPLVNLSLDVLHLDPEGARWATVYCALLIDVRSHCSWGILIESGVSACLSH